MRNLGKSILFVAGLLSMSLLSQEVSFVTEINPPFQFNNEKGELDGFSVEIVRALKDKSGISGEISAYPWARAYKISQEQPNVFIFTITRTKNRERLFYWIGNFQTSNESLFALKSRSDIKINYIGDAKKYRVAVPIDDAAAVRLESLNFNRKSLIYVSDQEQSVRMLHTGRVDLNLNNEQGFYAKVRELGIPIEDFTKLLVVEQTYFGLAASLGTSPELVEKMRAAFVELERSGVIATIEAKWFPAAL